MTSSHALIKEELHRFQKLSQKHQKQISVHIKIDSGMGRHGAWWEEAEELIELVAASNEINICGALTHFAQPLDLSFTQEQRNRFFRTREDSNSPPKRFLGSRG